MRRNLKAGRVRANVEHALEIELFAGAQAVGFLVPLQLGAAAHAHLRTLSRRLDDDSCAEDRSGRDRDP